MSISVVGIPIIEFIITVIKRIFKDRFFKIDDDGIVEDKAKRKLVVIFVAISLLKKPFWFKEKQRENKKNDQNGLV